MCYQNSSELLLRLLSRARSPCRTLATLSFPFILPFQSVYHVRNSPNIPPILQSPLSHYLGGDREGEVVKTQREVSDIQRERKERDVVNFHPKAMQSRQVSAVSASVDVGGCRAAART